MASGVSAPSQHSRAIFTVPLILLFTSGCSLIHPHLQSEADKLRKDALQECSQTWNVPKAREYAQGVSKLYGQAIEDHSTLNIVSGAGVVGFATAAITAAVLGGSRDLVTGLGAGAGVSYLAGSHFYSQPRQAVYIEGQKAILRAVAATDNLANVPKDKLDA